MHPGDAIRVAIFAPGTANILPSPVASESPRTVILLPLGQRRPGTLLLRQAAPWPISTYRAVGRGLWPALGNPRAPHTEDHPDGGLTTTSADGRKHRFALNGSVGQRQAGGTEAA